MPRLSKGLFFLFTLLSIIILVASKAIILANEGAFGYHAAYQRAGTCQTFSFDDKTVNAPDFIKNSEEDIGWKITRFSGEGGLGYWTIEDPSQGWNWRDSLYTKTGTKIFTEIACESTSTHPLDQEKCNGFTRSIIARYDGDCDANDDGDCTDRICKHSLTQSTDGCPESDKIAESPAITYPKIEYYQIGNEPYLCWYSWCDTTPELYADHFVATARVVKNLCPECKVALAGLEDKYKNFFVRVLRRIGSQNNNLVDIFDLHYFAHNYQEIGGRKWMEMVNQKNNLRDAFSSLGFADKKFFVTELNYYPDEGPTLTDRYNSQGIELPKFYIYGLTHGIDSIFWSPFLIEGGSFGEGFCRAGLVRPRGSGRTSCGNPADTICDNQSRKPSYQSYRTMARLLSGFSNSQILIDGNDSTYLYKFDFPASFNKTVLVGWSEGAGGKDINLVNFFPDASLDKVIVQSASENQPGRISSLTVRLFPTPKFIVKTTACPNYQGGNLTCKSSGKIDERDLNALLYSWAPQGFLPSLPFGSYTADLSGDRKVDSTDLDILKRNWSP